MEYFVVMNSYAAPFCSDTSDKFIEAESLDECKRKVIKEYKHPCGLYSAFVYASANDFHKNKEPLAKYLSNLEQRKQEATKGLGSYIYEGMGRDVFKVDGVVHTATPGGGWV